MQQRRSGGRELKGGGEQSSCQVDLSQSLSWGSKGQGTWKINIVFSKEEKKRERECRKNTKGNRTCWGKEGDAQGLKQAGVQLNKKRTKTKPKQKVTGVGGGTPSPRHPSPEGSEAAFSNSRLTINSWQPGPGNRLLQFKGSVDLHIELKLRANYANKL